ncbi:hypothetical protein OKW96_12690 [Sphingobacterium sp. KU25419]|jgi:hypothetical protein|nr:hypothetical protein OKW96_12690 [Sphingobacterium sp. KU25419]
MGNNCNLILGSFYTKNLVDELQLSMCVFLNKHKQKSIGLFLTSDLKVDNELLVSYAQKNADQGPKLIINEDLVLKHFNNKKEQFYYWKGTVATIRSMVRLLDFYCFTELGQKPVTPIEGHPFVIQTMHMLEEVEKRNLQIEAKLKQ